MKKVIALLVFLLGSTSLCFSQENQEINSLLSGKWKVQSMEIGNEKMEFSDGNNWLEFNTNGKYQVVMNDQGKEGTWKLNEEKNELEFDDESFESNLKIEKLNDKELLVSAVEDETVYTMVLKR
ncbi:lipocalin family protein [uncultured Tenacibaculum sp.]|uniref:lipocalin family protein n=1 Tax=uncultured Tenacibaculum sp. TaxID=174713 RepID=UPI00261DF9D5|nr:lipocalin family protein [uncultured Tenacibaculum sp.]